MAGVARLAKSTASSTFMVLHAALAALLHRMGGDDDVLVGTPVAGRTDEALDPLVGFFVNTLALRTDLGGDPDFTELLSRVRETDLAAYAHQELPFERLVEAVRPTRSLSRHPLFQVMLTLNNHRPPRLDLPGLRARLEAVDTGGAKFDLSFSFTERASATGDGNCLDGTLEYSRDLFDADTAVRIAERFALLLGQAVRDPGTVVGDLPLVGAEEQRRLLAIGESHGPSVADPAPFTTVLDRFAATVASARSGDIAVTASDGSFSFTELDTRSDRIAALLVRAGAGPGDPVAVLLPRSTDSIAALLGVLKAGAVYVPVDGSLPQGRIDAVLADARPHTVLTADGTHDLAQGDWRRLNLHSREGAAALSDGSAPPREQRRLNPASHLPPAHLGVHRSSQGVLVGHGSLARLLEHHRRHVFAPAVRAAGKPQLDVALTAALSFDAAWDPVLWMLDGHRLHVLDDLTRRDPEALVHAARVHGFDVLESTPTHVRQLLDAGLFAEDGPVPSVIALGGEAVPAALWNDLRSRPGLTAWNFYGPTEATVDTLIADLRTAERPVLGSPVDGTSVRLLDDRLRPVPVGVTGELYLAYDSLALGYQGQAAETATRFVPDPHGPSGARMYRTGDRAVRRSDDALEFMRPRRRPGQGARLPGRAGRSRRCSDGACGRRPGCGGGTRRRPRGVAAGRLRSTHRTVCHTGPDRPHGPLGCVPVRGRPAERDTGARGRPAARVHGPVRLGRPGRHPSDPERKAGPGGPARATGGRGERAQPPQPREDVLCTLFAETLELERVLIDDDFFEMGGHSLLAAGLIRRIRDALGVDVSIRSLFEAPTVAGLAERIGTGVQDNPLATLLPLRTKGTLPPLFCVHPAGGLAWAYAGLLPHLENDRPLYGLQTPNLDGTRPFPDSIEAMAAVYVAELRAVQPHGPYHLFGWSFGGNVVQEVAVQLQEASEEVALLTILDAFPLAPLDDLDSASRDTVFRALLSNMGVGQEALDGDGPVEAGAVRDQFRANGSPLGALEPATIDAMVDNFAGQARLMRRYTPRVFHGPALFFTAAEGRPANTFDLSLWDPYITGPIENHDVACAHAQMMQPAAREQIGTTVTAVLTADQHTERGDLS